MRPVALTIAGSDPSGGAGIQADLKTFHQFGVYGTSVLTVVTVQNTVSVEEVLPLDAALVDRQLSAVVEDIAPDAVKIGAIGSVSIAESLAKRVARFSVPLVVDPVMISTHGRSLADKGVSRLLAEQILPHTYLLTPNLYEASLMTGIEVSSRSGMEDAARRLADMGARNVLVKGGHLVDDATDILWSDGRIVAYPGEHHDTPHTHGTGCTYSAAITALLARHAPLLEAVGQAKAFISEAIRTAPQLGKGSGPVNHHASTADEAKQVS